MPIPTIKEPGIYDMPAEEYHADPVVTPSLSSSFIKIMVQETPLHAFTAHPRLNPNFERKEEDKFAIGNSAHSLMLGDPKNFAVGIWDDWRKKEAQEFKAANKKAGKIVLTGEQMDRVTAMVAIGKDQLSSAPDFTRIFRDGKPEQTLVWCEHEFQGVKLSEPLWFRVRLDWLHDDRTWPYDDYKTSESADPQAWSRVVFSVRHDIQAAFYRRGIRALGLSRNPQMRFVVQEVSEPHCLSVMSLSSEMMELADRDIDRGIRKFLWCRKMNMWPGYPARVQKIEAPAWLETQRMERETRIQEIADERKIDPDLLEIGFRSQAPI